MRAVYHLCALGAVLIPTVALGQAQGFGVALGAVFPIELQVDDRRPSARPGPMLLLSYDHPVLPSLDVGGFLHAGGVLGDGGDEQVNWIAFGGTAHFVHPCGQGACRWGGGLGYRRLLADLPVYDAVGGLALNIDVEWRLPLSHEPRRRPIVATLEVGGLGQPYGENARHEVRWLVMPYLAVGALF